MEFAVIFLATILVAYIILRKTNHKIKDHNVKKSEIIQQYEQELKKILENTKENSMDNSLKEKKKFLKNCNSELSRNIFFTQEEVSKIIKRLAQL